MKTITEQDVLKAFYQFDCRKLPVLDINGNLSPSLDVMMRKNMCAEWMDAFDGLEADLFAKVRSGQVRILMGSTPKLGAGTNVQDRLIALHHLDCPWKPSDLEQQEGRIFRQGNQNDKVKIFRYVTENTFDAYMWVRHEVA